MVPYNHSNLQYFDSIILLFSIAPCKVITPNPLCILFCISSLLYGKQYRKEAMKQSTKLEAKTLRATTFAIAKFGER